MSVEKFLKNKFSQDAEEARNLADKALKENKPERAARHENAASELQNKANKIDKVMDGGGWSD